MPSRPPNATSALNETVPSDSTTPNARPDEISRSTYQRYPFVPSTGETPTSSVYMATAASKYASTCSRVIGRTRRSAGIVGGRDIARTG